MAKKKEETGLAVVESAEVPAYIKNQEGVSRGSENVGMEDLTIPRLEIVQSLSPCRKKNDPAYIEGAEEGMLYNNVSRELYGTEVVTVPVMFKKEYLIWKDRKQGGGFRGAYDSLEDANAMIVSLVDAGDDPEGSLEAQDTGQHLCLLLKPDGTIEEIAISMSRSKMKVSRVWNTLVRMVGGDRFSRAYTISGVSDTNDANEEFYNLHVVQKGFPSEKAYLMAEALYKEIDSGGREMKVNSDQDESTADTDTADTDTGDGKTFKAKF